jgi:hypothetical protein
MGSEVTDKEGEGMISIDVGWVLLAGLLYWWWSK